MKLKNIFNLIVQEGIAVDPRDKTIIQDRLRSRRDEFEALNKKNKEIFDKERLTNPFDDTRILCGDPGKEIKTILAGIDIDSAEILLADRLNEKKKSKIDLIISHHPQGHGFANFYEVMDMQTDIFHSLGVPINIAEKLLEQRKKEVGRRIHAANHYRVSDTAKLLDMPFLCAHTPADNHAVWYLEKEFAKTKPKKLQDILNSLDSIEEYRISSAQQVAPKILCGSPQSRCGKIFVDMTGGTEGPKEIVDSLISAGIGTIVGMHLSEEHYKIYQNKNINCIIAGHIASDNLGMNLLLDKIEKAARIKILTCSGLRRVKR